MLSNYNQKQLNLIKLTLQKFVQKEYNISKCTNLISALIDVLEIIEFKKEELISLWWALEEINSDIIYNNRPISDDETDEVVVSIKNIIAYLENFN